MSGSRDEPDPADEEDSDEPWGVCTAQPARKSAAARAASAERGESVKMENFSEDVRHSRAAPTQGGPPRGETSVTER